LADQNPRVSFGIPVYNGADSIAHCLDSIARQDFTNYEVIVSDNASTDATRDVVREYAEADARVRLVVQPRNVGLIANFNAVASQARGEYFRWVGADDWLEPDYVSSCVASLDAHPEAIAATSYFDLVHDDGRIEYREYAGEFLESPSPLRRLERMLWFFHAGAALYEPTYCLLRRDPLLGTGLLRTHRNNDWLLSVRLALTGPFVHVPKRLFHRSWHAAGEIDEAKFARRLDPDRAGEIRRSAYRLFTGMLAMIDEVDLAPGDRRRARLRCARFCAAEGWRSSRNRFRRVRRSLGFTRAHFGFAE